MTVPAWAWVAFCIFIVAVLVADMLIAGRNRKQSMRRSVILTVVYVLIGLGIGVAVYFALGSTAAGEYYAGYVIELSLSVDNLFVFVMLFTYFAVPDEYQHRVLFYGVFGALVMRAVAILVGVTLLDEISWMIYVFGAILVVSALRMAIPRESEPRPDRNLVMRGLRRVLPMTDTFDGDRFFTKRSGKWMATPLVAALVAIETSDVIFAIDSIPAVLAVTRNSFLAFASNVAAILGLRAMYFVIADLIGKLRYLSYGLAAVLLFVGIKMLLTDVIEISVAITLAVIVGVLGVTAAASLIADRRSSSRSAA